MDADRRLVAELEDTFRAELDERLETMNDALLEIERGVSRTRLHELVESLFRDAHSLKGGAQLVGREELARLAHAAEAYLAAVRANANGSGVALPPLFAVVDALGRLSVQDSLPADELEAVIRGLEEGATDAEVSRAAPAAPGLPAARSGPMPAAANGGASKSGILRVSAERLDAVISRRGDLIAARDALVSQERELQGLAGELEACRRQWSELTTSARHQARDLPDGPLRRLLTDVAAVEPALAGPERRARAAAAGSRIAAQRFAQVADQLDAELRDLRMVPVARLFRQFPRMVRDVGDTLGKEVELHGIGWDTAIDRELLERLKDPVMHLLRNAVDHGIEPADERRRRRKPTTASVTLEARREGDRIVIEVRDDGGGIDRQRVVERAGPSGLVPEGEATGERALQLIFRPGLSTLDEASAVSGRGIGLDVVATEVGSLGGTVEVASDASGTAFKLRVPLTLISTRVLVVRAGGASYALPIDSVQRVLRFVPDVVLHRGGRQTVRVQGREHVVADLAAVLGHPPTPVLDGHQLTGVVVQAAADAMLFAVEAVEGEREVVVKPLGNAVGRNALIAGAALVDRDEVLLVLDHAGLVAAVAGVSGPPLARAEPAAGRRADAERPLRVLVADDSITTRTLEKNILAAAGFDVALAADGREALRTARTEPFDLVVSDVDMPGMDGFELTQRLRGDAATRELPVILVTAKEDPEDRERGLQVGADAYLLKREFDHQALLKTIREVVG